jgi:hypothetical protein
MERFDCPVCGMTFESEDGDEVADKVLEHVQANHPEWGTKSTKVPPELKSKSSRGWFKRGRG